MRPFRKREPLTPLQMWQQEQAARGLAPLADSQTERPLRETVIETARTVGRVGAHLVALVAVLAALGGGLYILNFIFGGGSGVPGVACIDTSVGQFGGEPDCEPDYSGFDPSDDYYEPEPDYGP